MGVEIIEKSPLNTAKKSYISDFKNLTCEYCDTNFAVDDRTTKEYGSFGSPYVLCPNCHKEVYIDDEEGEEIRPDNLSFPRHFYQFGKGVRSKKSRKSRH